MAAESLDKIRRDKIRNIRGRPRDWFPAPCQLCLLGPTEDDAIQSHEVGIVFVSAFTRREEILYSPRAVEYLSERCVNLLLEICFSCALEYWTEWHCGGPSIEPDSSVGSTEDDGEEEEHVEDPIQESSDTENYSNAFTSVADRGR